VKKEDIKRHLKTYSVYDKRRTTINHAFASAIAPSDDYSEKKLNEALLFLGQNPDAELICVFCDRPAETWDHLVGLVKSGELRGYGHQVGNLIPCCKECNSKKGSKDFDRFINESGRVNKSKEDLISLLQKYQEKFAKEINLTSLQNKLPEEFLKFQKIKNEMLELMKEADLIASKLRESILK
jgi:hypothetical protein